jgi:hypothetical protein
MVDQPGLDRVADRHPDHKVPAGVAGQAGRGQGGTEAAAGLNDWSDTDGPETRVGLVPQDIPGDGATGDQRQRRAHRGEGATG